MISHDFWNETCRSLGHAPKWLEIADEMKKREEYYWGWYCGRCSAILGEKGRK